MASVTNVQVHNLEESIFRSGYPMLKRAPTEEEFTSEVAKIWASVFANNLDDPHIQRAIKLANAEGGGHDQFLTGITVNFDLTFSNKAWVEAERYTFLNFVSSMSTMHRAAFFKVSDCCNAYTSVAEMFEAERLQKIYNEIDGSKDPKGKQEAYLELLYSIPAGFELMAGMTTNYRCLKNIYAQRRNHRLPDWQVFCDFIETLPLAEYLITGQKGK